MREFPKNLKQQVTLLFAVGFRGRYKALGPTGGKKVDMQGNPPDISLGCSLSGQNRLDGSINITGSLSREREGGPNPRPFSRLNTMEIDV